MCTRGLPDIYTLSPRACGPRASGRYIIGLRATRAFGITTKSGVSICHTSSRLEQQIHSS